LCGACGRHQSFFLAKSLFNSIRHPIFQQCSRRSKAASIGHRDVDSHNFHPADPFPLTQGSFKRVLESKNLGYFNCGIIFQQVIRLAKMKVFFSAVLSSMMLSPALGDHSDKWGWAQLETRLPKALSDHTASVHLSSELIYIAGGCGKYRTI
jgi:hypothetical protein